MATTTKRDLADRIAEKLNHPKAVALRVVQEFLDEVSDALANGNRLEFREFGVFEVKTRAARKARNPQTGDTVQIPERTVVRFKAGRKMKAAVDAMSHAAGIRTGTAT